MTTKTPKPTIAARAAERICPNCGGPAVRRSPRGPMPPFCSDACKRDHGNRGMSEGRAAIAFLKSWRADRCNGEIAKASFAQLCRIVDQFNAQDFAAHRPRPDLYAAKMLATGTDFMDRQGKKNLADARKRTAATAD
jgi:endogenous inhibitor of DNA gyrase (YacG/DUF329 family)